MMAAQAVIIAAKLVSLLSLRITIRFELLILRNVHRERQAILEAFVVRHPSSADMHLHKHSLSAAETSLAVVGEVGHSDWSGNRPWTRDEGRNKRSPRLRTESAFLARRHSLQVTVEALQVRSEVEAEACI